ncbi:autotransporter assembly complex family protein [Leptothrix ochracea]|uniref:autotransporter assembly complex protein TamA n=1 Tax=Leptothrix ochracea TaxID=735331 RepID=UPI0034E28222
MAHTRRSFRASQARRSLWLVGILGCCVVSHGTLAATPSDDAPETGHVTWQTDLDAPDDLKPLLDKYLDLSRFKRLGNDRIARSELQRLIAATPSQVRGLLETEGYFGSTAHVEMLATPAVTHLHLKVHVVLGPITRVEAFHLDVQGALAERAALPTTASVDPDAVEIAPSVLMARLHDKWALQPGHPFTQASWSDAKATLIALLRAQGYTHAAWKSTHAQIDPINHQATLTLVLDSGPLYRIGRISVNGLEHVNYDGIFPLFTFGEGEPLREKPLLDFQDRLVKTTLFETVGVTFNPDANHPESVPITINLRERALHQTTVGLGYSDNAGPRVTFEHLHQRFANQPWQGKTKVQWGRTEQLVSLDLTSHPVLGPFRNLLSGALSQTEAGGLVITNERVRVGRTQDSERIERLFYLEWLRATTRPTYGTSLTDDSTSATLNYQWVWRNLDHPILPTQGVGLSAEAGVGRSFHTLTDSGYFSRGTLRVTGYYPLGDSWYGQGRIQLGQVFSPIPSTSVPYTLLFRAGGDESIRGYGYQSLGPQALDGTAIGGHVLGTTSFEIAHPFTRNTPAWWWAAFYDAGQAAVNWAAFKPDKGYGLGVRWRSPVGPLRIDLAWAERLERLRLHFSIGITF